MSMDELIEKKIAVYTYIGVLSTFTKEGNSTHAPYEP